jgi:hypothetical protein
MPQVLPEDVGQGGKGVAGRPDPAVQYQPPKKQNKGKPKPAPVEPAAVQRYDTPTTPRAQPPPGLDPTLADRIILSAERTKAIYRDSVSDSTIYHAPDTTYHSAAVQNDAVTTEITNEVTSFFAQVYGNEYMAQLIAAENLPEPMRSKSIAAMRYLAGLTPDVTAATVRVPFSSSPTATNPQELIEQALADPSAVGNMGREDQVQVRSVAAELVSTLEELPDQGIAGDIKRAIAIGTSGNYRLALTEDDIATLKTVVGQLQGLKLGGTTEEITYAPGRDVGIEQVRQLGEGVIVLDLDDAKADPARAFAVRTYLEQNFPELDIQYGREGIWGSLVDKISMPLDYVSAPFGAALRQLGEVQDRMRTPEQRQMLLERADRIEQALATNDRPAYDEVRKELLPLFQLAGGVDPNKEQAWQEEASRAVVELRDLGTEEVGFKEFADQVVENTRPRTIGFGFADSFTRATDTLPGDSWYQASYLTSGLLAAVVLDPVNWGPGLIGGLKAAKVVPKLSRAKVEAVIADSANELVEAGKYLTKEAAMDAARASLKGVITEDAWFPIVGRGWVKNSAYRAFAKFPEEIVTTRPFIRATKRLSRLKDAVGEGEFFSALNRYFGADVRRGGGSEVAKMLSKAKGEDDMGISMMRGVLGLDDPGVNLDRFAQELQEVTAQLDLGPAATTFDDYTDLVGRRAHLDDVIRGRDVQRPLQQIFTRKQLRQLERTAKASHGAYGRTLQGVIGFTEKFPGNLVRWTERSPQPNGEFGEASRSLFIGMDNMYKPTGAGEVIVLPHAARHPGALRGPGGIVIENAVEDSFNHLSNIGRTLGLGDRRINEIMGGWSGLIDNPSASRGYDFLKEAWTTMVDESPHLNAFGKQDLKQMWKGFTSDRSPGWLTVESLDGSLPSPVNYREVIDPATGAVSRVGKPAIEADQLTVWRTPGVDRLREYLTLTQSTMKQWSKAGWSKRSVAGLHHAVTTGWSAVNSFWRTSVLGFRLFGALPARIFNEQMLRIAAYDYASAVWHPLDWFYSTKFGSAKEGAGFTTLFREHPGSALGVMVDQVQRHPGFQQIKAGREIVTTADGPMFYRAYADRLNKFYASPSTHHWHLENLGDTDATLNAMRTGKYAENGEDWLLTYAEYGMDPAEAVGRTQQELAQLIGTGEGADLVRTAIKRGEVNIDGKNYRVGTSDFAEKLQDMAESGRWQPGTQYMNRSAGDYLPLQRETGLTQFRDRLFSTFYSAPDLALSRSPMYRQMATREFKNLLGRGYSADKARRLAQARAARGTADMMFTIGAKTSGEYFLKNINPFFPAYRELATTWLKRVPLRIGEGHWGLGAAALVRRADIWTDFFKDLGVLQQDEQGKSFVPLPFFAPLVRLVTGIDAEFNVKTGVESFAGILPMPIGFTGRDEEGNLLPLSERVKGVFPTLGGPATFVLGALNDILPDEPLKMAEDYLTLYGTDSSLGPLSVDRFSEAFGFTMPWMTNTTQQYHEDTRTWAVIDGMRLAWPKMIEEFGPPPDATTDPKAAEKWAEAWLNQGEHYATTTYIMRGIAGMTLPFSIQIEDEGKQDIAVMWTFLNSLPQDDESGFKSAYIRSVLASNPKLQPYMTGKTLDTRLVDDPSESQDQFMQAVRNGDIKIRSAQDWSVFAIGSNVMSHFQAQKQTIYDTMTTPAEFMVDFEAQRALDEIDRQQDVYLDSTTVVDNYLDGQTQSFKDMWETWEGYNRLRDGKTTPRLSVEEQTILEISQLEDEIAKYFSRNPETSDDYYKIKDLIYEKLDYEPTSALGQAKSWYFDKVQSGYYDALDKLYKPGMTAEDFQKIRDHANEYNHRWVNADHPEWGEFAPPEEYAFLKLTSEDQQREVAGWADLPAYFLTEFQREQVGYSIPENKQGDASVLANYITRNEIKFDRSIDRYNISTASTTYEINRRVFDQAYADKAKELGLTDYWREANAPEYERLGNALNLTEQTQTWALAEKKARELTNRIETTEYATGQFYSAAGSSETAERSRAAMSSAVRTWRKNDAAFDQIIGNLQIWMGEEGKPLTQDELVDILFFNVYQA